MQGLNVKVDSSVTEGNMKNQESQPTRTHSAKNVDSLVDGERRSKIRGTHGNKDIPIIVISGFGSVKTRSNLLDRGLISAYFTKPFSVSEVVNTIRLLISDDFGNC